MTRQQRSYFERPLAPASLPVLAGVVALAIALMVAAGNLPAGDWLKVVGCLAVLALGAVILDWSGRRRAEQVPHPLYQSFRLPSEKSPLRTFFIISTLLVVMVFAFVTADPRKQSPLPYFLAVAFLYLFMPQVLARRIIRKHTSDDR